MNSPDSDDVHAQTRTVADLLAEHGRTGVPSGGGRRRRADDTGQAGAQEIIERVLGNDGGHGAHGPHAPLPSALAGRPPQHAAVPRGHAELPRDLDQATDRLPRIAHPLDAPRSAPEPQPEPEPEPPAENPSSPGARRRGWRLRRFGGRAAGEAPAPPADDPAPSAEEHETATATVMVDEPLPAATGEPLDVQTGELPDVQTGEPRDVEAGESAEAEPEEESPTREWLVMTSQLAIGAVGGAGLWLGFQWLWRSTPVVALVLALLVITALVWAVRRIRRSDDLQTTVVTVLVGLFVTVSPAALLLVDR